MVVAAFSDFMQQVVSGLASGGIYALLALALVIIHRSTGVINFAQGEMATLSTYIAWTLIANHGWRYGPAFVVTLLISFVGGVAIHRVVIRPVERGSVLRIVIVTIGLLVAINGFVIWQWGGEPQQLQSPFGTDTYTIGGVVVAAHDIGTIAVALGIVLLPLGALPVHEGRARAARRGGESGGGAARRRARHAGCSRSAGVSRRCSAPSPECSRRRRSGSTRT